MYACWSVLSLCTPPSQAVGQQGVWPVHCSPGLLQRHGYGPAPDGAVQPRQQVCPVQRHTGPKHKGMSCRIQSYRYTVAMFPLPYKNVLRYRMRQNVGGASILVFNTKCTRECRPHFAACGTPDRAMSDIRPRPAVTSL
jgi:hypothetical protein